MPSILQEFAYGNINPNERPFTRNTEYERAYKALSDSEEKLLSALGENEKALYERYAAAQRDFSLIADMEQYVNGYKLGALMMMEIMAGKDEVTR